jgi:tetratricopeptide (TPR) repeat protein
VRTAADLDDSIRDLVIEGRTAWAERDYGRARQLFEQALRLATDAHDLFGQMAAHHFLGNIAFSQSRGSESRQHHNRALALARADGDYQGIATSLGSLAHLELADRHIEPARKLYGEAVAAYQLAGMNDAAANLRTKADDLLSGRITVDALIADPQSSKPQPPSSK